jgi:hypothetical protein
MVAAVLYPTLSLLGAMVGVVDGAAASCAWALPATRGPALITGIAFVLVAAAGALARGEAEAGSLEPVRRPRRGEPSW